jgi:hypothetical protein
LAFMRKTIGIHGPYLPFWPPSSNNCFIHKAAVRIGLQYP